MHEKVIRYSNGALPPSRFFPNFVSGHLQKKAATKKSKAISELLCGSFSIVIAGNIGFAQNGENILEAIRICQRTENITLHFIGEAPINDATKHIKFAKHSRSVFSLTG